MPHGGEKNKKFFKYSKINKGSFPINKCNVLHHLFKELKDKDPIGKPGNQSRKKRMTTINSQSVNKSKIRLGCKYLSLTSNGKKRLRRISK